MNQHKKFAFYCRGREFLDDGDVMILLGCNDGSDYLIFGSDLQKLTSNYAAYFFFDPKANKEKLTIDPVDFQKVVGKYILCASSCVETGIPE